MSSVSKMFHAIHSRPASSSDISTLYYGFFSINQTFQGPHFFPFFPKAKSFPCLFSYQEGHKMSQISHVPLTLPFHHLFIHPHIPSNPAVALYSPHFHKFLTFSINLPHIAFYSNLPLWIAFEAISIIRHIIYPQSGKTIP